MNKSIKDVFYECKKYATKWSSYFPVYEKHFNKFIGKSPKILEIGVNDGGSVEMWLNYFGEGTQIVGIDNQPRCLEFCQDSIEIVIGDQGSEEFWDTFLEKHNDFDIVIDDGGHHMNQQIVTLMKVFPKLKDDGVFLTEDTHTSYWEDWGGAFRKKGTFLEYSKNIIDQLTLQHYDQKLLEDEIKNAFHGLYSITHYNSIVVLEKKLNIDGSFPVYSNQKP
jgi:SAM-dependent methyltransferase